MKHDKRVALAIDFHGHALDDLGAQASLWFGQAILLCLSSQRGLNSIADNCTIQPMNVVADTNIFLAVVLEEESKERIIEITAGCDIYAPEILPYEIGNALSAMAKRQRIKQEDIAAIFGITQEIPVSLTKINIERALTIAVQQNIYAYDAYFLQCSLTLSSPLLTLDESLKRVAIAMNISLLE